MEITEKVAYLKGLAEGMELDTEKKEGKLLAAIIDVLDDIALELADMKADQEELYDGLDAVSDDLEDVEDAVFGEDDEDEEDEIRVRGAGGGRGLLRHHLPHLRGDHLLRRVRPGGRRGHLPQLRREAGV